ncbi:MAG: hypothetical protein IKZ60_02490 [Bacteroidales bacterium]|nr:hypothetical protein [Bacteroidales bacterium]
MKAPKRSTVEAVIFLAVLIAVFWALGSRMGGGNMLKTMMNTAHDLLLNTVFYLMGITVLTGALSKLMAEFGVVTLLEKVLRPLMKPLFNLPGVAALGAVMTFLSDNPAIIALSKDRSFASYFKKYQLISLTNFGTAFGMGFVVLITMFGYGSVGAAFVGLFGAFCGSIISTRLMQRSCRKAWPAEMEELVLKDYKADEDESADDSSQKNSIFMRFLNAILDGGKNGVELGLQIIPGVLIITTAVIMITFGPGSEGYTGAAAQGVPILPWLADKIHWVFEWLFGFKAMELIAFPMTALGAVGAALGLLPTFEAAGFLDGNAIAVCTAIGMCWSGYLSTHTAMLDSLGWRKAIPKALGAHTIAGLCAGIIAHFTFLLVGLL